MTIFYQVDLDEAGNFYGTIDVSQSVSMLSRKRYRQGLEWAVSGIRVNSPQACQITIATLPQTWSCAQAWKTSFRAWRKMRHNAEDGMTVDTEARYADFKIAFDDAQSFSGDPQYAPLMLPYGTVSDPSAVVYDWTKSNFTWPDDSDMAGAERTAHMIGDDASIRSFGMIHNYANLRKRPQQEDPNVPELGRGSVLTSLFDYGGDADPILGDITIENSEPPYYVGLDTSEEEFYPGGKNYRADWYSNHISVSNVYSSGAGTSGNGFIPGFTAYCGLIRVAIGGPVSLANIGIYLDLLPGGHDGYMARPMQDVN